MSWWELAEMLQLQRVTRNVGQCSPWVPSTRPARPTAWPYPMPRALKYQKITPLEKSAFPWLFFCASHYHRVALISAARAAHSPSSGTAVAADIYFFPPKPNIRVPASLLLGERAPHFASGEKQWSGSAFLEEFVVFCWVDGEEPPAPSCTGMAQLLCHLLLIYHQDLSYTLRDGREGCPNCTDSALSSGAFTWEEQASFPSAPGQKYLRASPCERRNPQCSPSCPCSQLAGKQPAPSDTKAQEHSVPAPFFFSRQRLLGCPHAPCAKPGA